MSGKVFAEAKYFYGHPELGRRRIKIQLSAYPTNLTLTDKSSRLPLLSIPWPNILKVDSVRESKKGLEDLAGFILREIPFFPLDGPASYNHNGFVIVYWDEDVQRNQEIFIVASREKIRDRMMNAIWKYRDNFFRTVGGGSRPDRRF